MFFASLIRRVTVHKPQGIPFQISASEAVALVKKKHNSQFLCVNVDFLTLSEPSAEFLPFYFCGGSIDGIFRGFADYNNLDSSANSANKTASSGFRQFVTSPQPLRSTFGPHQTQIYAGYKYNIHYVHQVFRSETNPLHLKKMTSVNVEGASINLFEQSTRTLKVFIDKEVGQQAKDTASALVRSYHPGAFSVNVEFSELHIHLDDVMPVFMPCYVVKATYDQREYTLYVNGFNGQVGGPFLINSLYVGRAAALLTAAVSLFLSPNKGAGFIIGSVLALPIYYIAFYTAKYLPLLQRNYFRQQREKLRERHMSTDHSGFRPDVNSERINEEYRHSSYWDTHDFQKKPHSAYRRVNDSKGYYAALGLTGNESVNEIRSAYRRLVITEHPDAGGSTERTAKLNEAYRVLRDPKRREEYDRTC
uniref:Putative chaperone protein DNAj n=1 Tax=Trypanosoma congolense (strain IL3000) TaxID=1068625 RepID=G0V0L4_TRYCI|nr:putative chaperone protein DNAj [Trypanosoma congolense IL3000]